jgi:hypothetical protein
LKKINPCLKKKKKKPSYIKHLYHHPPMIKEVEEKSSLTELYLKSTILTSDHLFDQQFQINHLDKNCQTQTTEMFWKHQEALSKHASEPHVEKHTHPTHSHRSSQTYLESNGRIWNQQRMQWTFDLCSNYMVAKKDKKKY